MKNDDTGLFWLGGVKNEEYLEHKEKGTPLPSLHNSGFAPHFRPAFVAGVSAMSKTIINLMEK